MRHLAAQAAPPRSDTAGPIGLLGSPPRGASTASARLDDVTAKLTDAQAELAAAQDKAEASSAEVLTLARKVNEAAEADDRRAAGRGAPGSGSGQRGEGNSDAGSGRPTASSPACQMAAEGRPAWLLGAAQGGVAGGVSVAATRRCR